MNKRFIWVIGALVIALLAAGVFGADAAFADDRDRPRQIAGHAPCGPRGGHGLDGAGLEAAAGALGMSTEDLAAVLEAGTTLPELAQEAGVAVEQVFEAMGAARAESVRERIEQGLEDGSLTQDQADWLLEGLEKGYLDGPGSGLDGRFERGAAKAAPVE